MWSTISIKIWNYYSSHYTVFLRHTEYIYIFYFIIGFCEYIPIYSYVFMPIPICFLYVLLSHFILLWGFFWDFSLEWPFKLNDKSAAGHSETVWSKKANIWLLKQQWLILFWWSKLTCVRTSPKCTDVSCFENLPVHCFKNKPDWFTSGISRYSEIYWPK